VDRLSIIAHDRFQEIIDDANKADSPIRLKTFLLDAPEDGDGPPQSVTVAPSLSQALGLTDGVSQVGDVAGGTQKPLPGATAPVSMFATERERQAQR